MGKLSTSYLGLKLRTPLVVSASPLSHEIDGIRRLEDAGASAVVLFSLFEEQLREDATRNQPQHSNVMPIFTELPTYFPKAGEFHLGPAGYLTHIRRAKKAVKIPIIASLNCANVGTWTEYARQIEEAGADGIECNIYSIPTNPAVSSSDVEQVYLDILRAIKHAVKIPVAVKLGPFFTNMAYMARRLDECGMDGLVMFNPFYQPDVDLKKMELAPSTLLATPHDMRLPLTWIGILFGRVRASLAATSGIHTFEDVIKLLMVGANVTMLCSVLLENGLEQIRIIENGLRHWMSDNEYESVTQMQGTMSQLRYHDPSAMERGNTCEPFKVQGVTENRN